MTIVVTGATGNVGRPLVAELAAAGARVRAVTRTPKTAGFPAGVEVVGSAVDALPGASAVFLNSRALGDSLADVVARRAARGVTKLVALSAINADDDFSRQPSRFRGDRNKEVEAARRRLRPGLGEPAARGFRDQLRRHVVGADPRRRCGRPARTPRRPARRSSRADIAAVAARALLTDELVGQRIPLTGPQAFTNAELVEVIGTVLDRPLHYRRGAAGCGAATVHRLGFRRRIRRRLHGDARRDARQARAGHPRSGKDHSAGRRPVRARGFPSTATCSRNRQRRQAMSEPRPPRYLKPMNKVMMAVQKLGIPTGPAMVLTVPGRKSGQPRSTPMTPFEFRRRSLRGGRLSRRGLGRQRPGRRHRHARRGRRSRRVRIVELTADASAPGAAGFPGRSSGRRRLRETLGNGRRRHRRRIRGTGGPHRRLPIRPIRAVDSGTDPRCRSVADPSKQRSEPSGIRPISRSRGSGIRCARPESAVGAGRTSVHAPFLE